MWDADCNPPPEVSADDPASSVLPRLESPRLNGLSMLRRCNDVELQTLRVSKLFWAGLVLLMIGSVPLLAVMLFSRDPDPNPIGFGMLAFLTFWPAVIMIVVGWNRSYR